MITDEELDAIDARAEAATPGPLTARPNPPVWTAPGHDPGDPGWVIEPAILDGACEFSEEDATFFAGARAGVLRLTRELRKERAAHATTRADLATVVEDGAARARRGIELQNKYVDLFAAHEATLVELAEVRGLFANTRAAEAVQAGCVAKLRDELQAARAEIERLKMEVRSARTYDHFKDL